MAFDAAQEEYRRLGLRFAREQAVDDAFSAARAAASFNRRFAWSHDSLPQTDGDRAFHLVARAAELIDRELPFVEAVEGEVLIGEARTLLDEAVALDPACHDARRMIAAQESPSFEEYYRFLKDGVEAVRADVAGRADEIRASGVPGAETEAELARYPLYRWLASLAARALISGRYRTALAHAEELLALDPADHGDVRFTAALAYAKLEDAEGLASLVERCSTSVPNRPLPDAWTLLATMALAVRRGDEGAAHEALAKIVSIYPHAGITLSRQEELPDGVFARLPVAPYSNDELVLAVSEASVLLQEGVDVMGRGSLGSFVDRDPAVVDARLADEAALAPTQQGSEEGSR